MKNQFNFSILIILLLAVFAVGCSFRKDGKKLSHDVPDKTMEHMVHPLAPLEEVFDQGEESEIVRNLAFNFNKYEKEAKTANETLLDVAIRWRKSEVIKYLMFEKGVNPFHINRNSTEILDANSQLKQLLVGAHQDVFMSILQNRQNIQSEIIKADLAEFGCKQFTNFLMRYRYDIHPDNFEPVTKKDVDEVIISTLSQTECKNYLESFPESLISEWMTQEFVNQFRMNFQSSKFLLFLKTLVGTRKSVSISIKVPNLTVSTDEALDMLLDRKDFSDRNFRIIPAQSLVKLKSPCIDSSEQLQIWTDLSKELQNDFSEGCGPRECISSIKKIFYNFVSPYSEIQKDRFERVHDALLRRRKYTATKILSQELCGKELELQDPEPLSEQSSN
ncbi:hypothetical protein [Bdellovibrio reynosensis]|uniref:Ankyrin repeat domain-containing protein n=1 Tax=Bdellovibrio reynosensis TaxID=2835041 RepID=A0ABY4C766_9BACT|nr:hypothetical protein [Bdellovibrio reynosensis]UOF00549.1 hypothetical protein MNR06_12655 [Bdellovibrio reynosensis]